MPLPAGDAQLVQIMDAALASAPARGSFAAKKQRSKVGEVVNCYCR